MIKITQRAKTSHWQKKTNKTKTKQKLTDLWDTMINKYVFKIQSETNWKLIWKTQTKQTNLKSNQKQTENWFEGRKQKKTNIKVLLIQKAADENRK